MYPGLTHGAYSAIHAAGTPEQKDLYLPKLASFQWGRDHEFDRAAVRYGPCSLPAHKRRSHEADGTYKNLRPKDLDFLGQEHDLTENIVHLVLARIEGAPAGHPGHQPVHRAGSSSPMRMATPARAIR